MNKYRYKVGDNVVVTTSDSFLLWERGGPYQPGTVVAVTEGVALLVRFSKKRFGLWNVYRDLWVNEYSIRGVIRQEAQ